MNKTKPNKIARFRTEIGQLLLKNITRPTMM